MFVVANLLTAVAQLLGIILLALQWLIIIWAVLSWVSPDPNNPLVRTINKLAEPMIYPIRKILPFSLKFGVDISPFIALLIILFLQKFLVRTMFEWAARIKIG